MIAAAERTTQRLEILTTPEASPATTVTEPEVLAPVRKTSERRLAANQANSRKSTGPRSQAGKAKVRSNAITHGLLASMPLAVSESGMVDKQQLRQLVRQLHEDFDPTTQLEMTLIEYLAFDLMRLSMIHGMSALFFADLYQGAEGPRMPITCRPPPLPEGCSEEQVRHENDLASQMILTLEARQHIQLSPADAEAMTRHIFDAATRNAQMLYAFRQDLESLAKMISVAGPSPSAAAGVTQTPPTPESTRRKHQLEEQQASLIAEIGERELLTTENMGLDSPEVSQEWLEGGVCVPDDRRPFWTGLLSQVVQHTSAILKGLDTERRRNDGKRSVALRKAIDQLPRLENLHRYEGMVRRSIDRTINQLERVRHDLFA